MGPVNKARAQAMTSALVVIDRPAPRAEERHRLPGDPPRLDEALDLPGRERAPRHRDGERVAELLALLRPRDARDLPQPLAAADTRSDLRPLVLFAEELANQVLRPAGGKQVLRVHQDVFETEHHRNFPPASSLAHSG